MQKSPIIIIGNGISGVTAAREIRKRSDQRIVLISEEGPYMISRPALMYVYMGHMQAHQIEPYERSFWTKNRIELLHASVQSVDPRNQQIRLADGRDLQYDKLVLATGSRSKALGLPHETARGIVNLYHWQDLEQLESLTHPFGSSPKDYKVHQAVIIGGGLIGVELAEMLHTRGIQVAMIIRDTHFWGSQIDAMEAALIQRQLDAHHIRTIYSSAVQEIIITDDRVSAVRLSSEEIVDCQLVGITIGVEPNTTLASHAGIECDKGIRVDATLCTSDPHVYAIGDCAQLRHPSPHRKSIEAVWYTGKMMGETVARSIAAEPTNYDPGLWFNSAKFFHLEYQTYGHVAPLSNENERHFFWMNSKGDQAIKIAFHPASGQVLGINSWGIRIRQERAHTALSNHWSVDEVIQQLPSFFFDAEFTPSIHHSIIAEFVAHPDLNPNQL